MKWVHWNKVGAPPEPSDLPPVFIEGLPGMGHVGQLAAQHLVNTLDGKLWRELHSPDFPPQAIVNENGLAHLCCLRLWTVAPKDGAPPMIVLTGDTQPLTPHGQFQIASEVLDLVQEHGSQELFTLGGLGARNGPGRVLGAASSDEALERMKEAGALFDELGPEGGIIGASGVLLGMAPLRAMQGGCLMGESDGSLVDVKAAEFLLGVLGPLVGRDIPVDGLEAGAKRIEEQLQFLDEVRYFAAPPDPADNHYIG